MMTSNIDYGHANDSVLTRFLIEKQHRKDAYIIQYDGLINSDKWTDTYMTCITITMSSTFHYPLKFRQKLYEWFKLWNLNAVIGCIESHPHKVGLHAHCIVYGPHNLEAVRAKGVYIHIIIPDDIRACHMYLNYMFKDLKPYCVFSNHNVYGRLQNEIEEKALEAPA